MAASPCQGVWGCTTPTVNCYRVTLERSKAISRLFNGFQPESILWWNAEDDGAVLVCALNKHFPMQAVYLAYHQVLAAVQWDDRFEPVVEKIMNSKLDNKVYEYMTRNKRYYTLSSVICEDDGHGRCMARLVRRCDGHVVTVLAEPEWIETFDIYTEMSVSHRIAPPKEIDGRWVKA